MIDTNRTRGQDLCAALMLSAESEILHEIDYVRARRRPSVCFLQAKAKGCESPTMLVADTHQLTECLMEYFSGRERTPISMLSQA